MASSENAFRQLLGSWNSAGRQASSAAGQRPILAEWTDYFQTEANSLYQGLPTILNPLLLTLDEPLWFQLGRVERLIGFAACLASSFLCFILCVFMFPVLALQPRKFGLLWTMGSLLFMVSFGVLQGPRAYLTHLLSPSRIIFSLVYFGLVALTLYCAVGLRSGVLTAIASVAEIMAVLYYTVSYFPFGALTLTWFSSYMMGYIGGFVGGIL